VEPLASDPTLPILVCSRIAHRIRIDGDPHKAPWTATRPVWLAPAQGGPPPAAPPPELALRQLAPDAPPLDGSYLWQPTAVRACRDDVRLYLLFQCVDRDVWGSYHGRNQPIYEEEVVEAFLAPGPDPRCYLELETSPRGAWFEARVESPDGDRRTMRVDRDWRCMGWERAVQVRGTLERRDDLDVGWTVEWAIPFAALGAAAPEPGARWRANFYRIDREGAGQFAAWSPTLADPPDFHRPDRFGWLLFE
jgi:hypothetical protein